MKITYTSNNSGGGWRLKDKDWKALEKAGWYILWGGQYFCHSDLNIFGKPEDKPEPCDKEDSCKGHRKYDKWTESKNNRHLGALAKEAWKEFDTIKEAIEEFEKITKQDVTDEGCNCCGCPHTFEWGECHWECDCKGVHKDMNWASGENLLEYMFENKDTKLSKREMLNN